MGRLTVGRLTVKTACLNSFDVWTSISHEHKIGFLLSVWTWFVQIFFFTNSIKYNCFVLSKYVRNLNCELRHLRKFKTIVTALSEPFLDSYWFPIIFAKSIRKASLRLVAPSDATCAQYTKNKQINRNLSDISFSPETDWYDQLVLTVISPRFALIPCLLFANSLTRFLA